LNFGFTGCVSSTDVIKQIDEHLSHIQMEIPEVDKSVSPAFSSRAWVRQAIRVLNSEGFIKCSDISALEKECRSLARKNWTHIAFDSGPFRVFTSQHSI